MKKYFVFLLLLAAVLFFLISGSKTTPTSRLLSDKAEAVMRDRLVTVPIQTGDTFSSITETLEIPVETVAAILATSTPVYDLAGLRAGKELHFYFNRATSALKKLTYEPTTEEVVEISLVDGVWRAEKKAIAYEIQTKKITGTIHRSLYETAVAQGIDIRAVIELAEMFAWQIDFAVEVREGDTFSVIFEAVSYTHLTLPTTPYV